jgi:transposase
MGAKHTTDREKQLFQHLVSTGMSVRNVSRLTGRSHACITENLNSDVVVMANHAHMTEEQMFSVFDKDSQNIPCADIARQINKPHSTVYKVIRRIYPKQQKAYEKWLELQKEKDAPALVMEVQPVEEKAVPAALLAIRAARAAGRSLHQVPVEVQTTKSEPCDCDCNFTDSKICQAMSSSIDHHRKLVAEYKETITKQISLIAECQETITLLKEHIQLLKSLR